MPQQIVPQPINTVVGDFSSNSYDTADMQEQSVNMIKWSTVEEANTRGMTRGILHQTVANHQNYR